MSLRTRDLASNVLFAAVIVGVAVPSVLAQGSGQIVGSVVDEDGNGVGGAIVRAENPDLTPPMFETTADEDGNFAIIGFRSGAWAFMAQQEGYHPDTVLGVRVRQAQNQPVHFTLKRVRHRLEIALGEEAFKEGVDPAAIEQELEAADDAFKSEQWDEAIARYNAILEQLPNFSDLHMQVGNAHWQRTEYPLAIEAFERALEGNPDNEEAKIGIARTRMAMGDFEAASAELAATAESGDNASREDLFNLGELEFAKGAIDEAARWYERASVADPKWGKPLFKLALVALNKGDMETAKEYFRQVVDVASDSEEGAQAAATLAALP